MKKLYVCKASPIGDRLVEGAMLVVDGDIDAASNAIPTDPRWETAVRALYQSEASKVREALRCLPQGTRYELLLLLLQDAPVMYRAPMPEKASP